MSNKKPLSPKARPGNKNREKPEGERRLKKSYWLHPKAVEELKKRQVKIKAKGGNSSFSKIIELLLGVDEP